MVIDFKKRAFFLYDLIPIDLHTPSYYLAYCYIKIKNHETSYHISVNNFILFTEIWYPFFLPSLAHDYHSNLLSLWFSPNTHLLSYPRNNFGHFLLFLVIILCQNMVFFHQFQCFTLSRHHFHMMLLNHHWTWWFKNIIWLISL